MRFFKKNAFDIVIKGLFLLFISFSFSACHFFGQSYIIVNDRTPPILPSATVPIIAGTIDRSVTPAVIWPVASDENSGVSHYEIQIKEFISDVTVESWKTSNLGSILSGLNLQDDIIYYMNFRAIDRSGNVSNVVSSQPWIPGSVDCFGDRVSNAPYGAGTGATNDPFLICTPQQFMQIDSRAADFDKRFKLGANLNFSSMTFGGLGTNGDVFTGVFDGNNKEIRSMVITYSGTTNNHGLFNEISYGRIFNLKMKDYTINAALANVVGGIVGNCENSQIANVTLENTTINGASIVAGIIGQSLYCQVFSANIEVTINSTQGLAAGIISTPQKSFIFNVNATVSVNSATADFVGGIIAEDWWSPVKVQNTHVSGSVTGKNFVGGFLGNNYDGGHLYRSSFTGTVTGIDNVGGMIGHNGDSPFSVNACFSTATVTGNRYVGGFAGFLSYRADYSDSYFSGSLIGSGAFQEAFGGFWGAVDWGGGNIHRSYSVANISTAANRVGGAIGWIGTWDASGNDIANSFVVPDVIGLNAAATISRFMGENTSGNPLLATNSYFWSGGTCNNTGGGGCNATAGATEASSANFYNNAHGVFSTWDFTNVWVQNATTYPTLNFNQTNTPNITSEVCDTVAIVGSSYSCFNYYTDADLNEIRTIKLLPEHTCHWLFAYNGVIRGRPTISDVGTCRISWVLTDGTNDTPAREVDVTVRSGLTITPHVDSHESGVHYWGIAVAGGASSRTFTLTNNDSANITGINLVGLPSAPYDFTGGGAYPGTGGTCGASLNVGLSCTIRIQFDPSIIGTFPLSLTLNYTSASGAVSVTIPLSGEGF